MKFRCEHCLKILPSASKAAEHEREHDIKHVVDGLDNLKAVTRREIIAHYCRDCGYALGTGHDGGCPREDK